MLSAGKWSAGPAWFRWLGLRFPVHPWWVIGRWWVLVRCCVLLFRTTLTVVAGLRKVTSRPGDLPVGDRGRNGYDLCTVGSPTGLHPGGSAVGPVEPSPSATRSSGNTENATEGDNYGRPRRSIHSGHPCPRDRSAAWPLPRHCPEKNRSGTAARMCSAKRSTPDRVRGRRFDAGRSASSWSARCASSWSSFNVDFAWHCPLIEFWSRAGIRGNESQDDNLSDAPFLLWMRRHLSRDASRRQMKTGDGESVLPVRRPVVMTVVVPA